MASGWRRNPDFAESSCGARRVSDSHHDILTDHRRGRQLGAETADDGAAEGDCAVKVTRPKEQRWR
jgi:hypothetical protein